MALPPGRFPIGIWFVHPSVGLHVSVIIWFLHNNLRKFQHNAFIIHT